MLYLESSIHLHEVEFIGISVKNKLYCACIVVTYGFSRSNSSLSNLGSHYR
jgi:hypothetical protein